MMRAIKIGVSSLTATKLVDKAVVILEAMTDNANFVTPNPTLAELESAKNELSLAIGAAKIGGVIDRVTRDTKMVTLARLIRLMAYYVTSVGEGNEDVLASSGFELKKLPAPMAPVSNPVDFLAQRTQLSGAIKLNWKVVRGARSYVIEMTKQNPAEEEQVWEQVQVTSKSKALLEDLDVGTFYSFRVRAIGSANKSGWSDYSQVMVA